MKLESHYGLTKIKILLTVKLGWNVLERRWEKPVQRVPAFLWTSQRRTQRAKSSVSLIASTGFRSRALIGPSSFMGQSSGSSRLLTTCSLSPRSSLSGDTTKLSLKELICFAKSSMEIFTTKHRPTGLLVHRRIPRCISLLTDIRLTCLFVYTAED